MKEFIGTCVGNPFGTSEALDKIIDEAEEITIKEFLAVTEDITPELELEMRRYPDDFAFYRSGNIYYYEWSAIEHFYK